MRPFLCNFSTCEKNSKYKEPVFVSVGLFCATPGGPEANAVNVCTENIWRVWGRV